MLKAVLFDMDGTVFDTERMLYWGWEQLVASGDMPKETLTLFFDLCGRNREEGKKLFRERFGADFPIEEMYAKRTLLINERLEREGMPLKPYVPQIFRDLRSCGLRLALVTGTSRASVEAHMRRSGFGKYFEHIVSGDRVEHSKPAPDIFLLAAREMNLRAEECLVVEDSFNGVRAGYAAGMRVVMIPDILQPNEEIAGKAYRVCQTLDSLPAITRELILKNT